MTLPAYNALGRLRSRAKTYLRNGEGSAAIEFGLLAIPFFMLIFGILELAIILFLNATMTHAVGEAGRQIRVGNFQACGGDRAEEFKKLICEKMSTLGRCSERLSVDVKSGPNFQSIVLPDPPEVEDTESTIPNGTVDSTVGGEPVVARAVYYYSLVLPAQITRLETNKGSGIRKLQSSTAFRNEPFSAPGTCPS
jgi:Flp pilus assembly protein TadG